MFKTPLPQLNQVLIRNLNNLLNKRRKRKVPLMKMKVKMMETKKAKRVQEVILPRRKRKREVSGWNVIINDVDKKKKKAGEGGAIGGH